MSLDQPQTEVIQRSFLYHTEPEPGSPLLGSIATVTLQFPEEYGYTTEFKLRTELCQLTDRERWMMSSNSSYGLKVQLFSYGNILIQDTISHTHKARQAVVKLDRHTMPGLTIDTPTMALPVLWLRSASPIDMLSVGDKAGLQSSEGYIRGMAEITSLHVVLAHSAAR